MIIQGHPDILLGPQGLNGLHGFAGLDAAQTTPSDQEIRDFVATHTQAEIQAAMARTGVTQTDIIQAFEAVDAATSTGQSPAVTRFLPQNGGQGLPALYKEINDFVNTHTLNEILVTMAASGVSRADVDAANAYAFSQSQAGGATGAATTAAQQTASVEAARAAGAAVAAQEAQYAANYRAIEQAAAAQAAQVAAAQAAQIAAAAQAAAAQVAPAQVAAAQAATAQAAQVAAAQAAAKTNLDNRVVDCFPGYAWDGEMCRATGLQEPTGAGAGVNLPLVIAAIAAYFALG